MKTATKTTGKKIQANEYIAKYDLLYHTVLCKLVRFVRWEGSAVVVCDRNSLVELPDWWHHTQIERA